MDAENSENKEVATTDDNGVDDNNNNTKKGVLVAEDPSEKKDINSADTADLAAKDTIPPESGENLEEKEVDNDHLNRKIVFVLQRFDPDYGEKEEYQLYLPDGSSQVIVVNDNTTIVDLTERLDKWVDPRMLFVGIRRKQIGRNGRYTGRVVTQDVIMPWFMKEIKKHKWEMVVCFRSEKESR